MNNFEIHPSIVLGICAAWYQVRFLWSSITDGLVNGLINWLIKVFAELHALGALVLWLVSCFILLSRYYHLCGMSNGETKDSMSHYETLLTYSCISALVDDCASLKLWHLSCNNVPLRSYIPLISYKWLQENVINLSLRLWMTKAGTSLKLWVLLCDRSNDVAVLMASTE